MIVAGQTFTINQLGTCAFTIDPASISFTAIADTKRVYVNASDESCPWTAVSHSDWITIKEGSSGVGKGLVDYSVTANTSCNHRIGTLTIAGNTFTVDQDGEKCTVTVNETSKRFAAAGGTASIVVDGSPDCCTWSAAGSVPWINITGGSPGTGDGTATYSVLANATNSQRIGEISISGNTYTVIQDTGVCAFIINPTSTTFSGTGGTGSVVVDASVDRCEWTAVSSKTWIRITGGLPGLGDGTVTYSVAANPGTSRRTGAITIAGKIFTIVQDAGACTFALSPSSQTLTAIADTKRVFVDASSNGCAWAARSNNAWITLTDGTSGTGDGLVNYSVTANMNCAQRTGSISIAGKTFNVTQAGKSGCPIFDSASESLNPACAVLSIESNTTDGSKTFTDGSASGNIIAPMGDVHHGNSAMFSGSSVVCFDGSGDYLKLAPSANWNFGTDDFTIDLWLNFAKITDSYQGIFSNASSTKGFYLCCYSGKFMWYHKATGWLDTGTKPVAGQWYHLAVVRSGNTLTIYVNGSREITSDCAGAVFDSSGDGVVIGSAFAAQPKYYFNGSMDEITVYRNCARWMADFTPPNNPGAIINPK